MSQRTAVVVGAGVGGLTAALALHQRGWRVTVLERAKGLRPVGAGVGLTPNAVKALDTLGLTDWLKQAAALEGLSGVRRPDGTWLAQLDLSLLEKRFGRPFLVLPRAKLIDALVDLLPAHALRLDAPVTQVVPGSGDRPAVARTPDGELSAEVVVAADGINSSVRTQIFPRHPVPAYAGFTAWRMITKVPSGGPDSPSVTWGRGAIFGIVPMADGELYCYATANVPRGTAFPDVKAALCKRFAGWHHPIPEIVRAAVAEDLLRHDVFSLAPLPAYHHGRVALLGDAAHAMTPNLAQGACQAIEDAVVLAHRLGAADGGPDVPAALAQYTADRLDRTARIARNSARVGRLQQLDSPTWGFGRDTLARLAGRLGPRPLLRQLDPIAGWLPPSGPATAPGQRSVVIRSGAARGIRPVP